MTTNLHRTRAPRIKSCYPTLIYCHAPPVHPGGYKPLGVSGEAMIDAMTDLRPEIYGAITDPERVELEGLLYVMQRLPIGIEECRYIRLISREGFEKSGFEPIVPPKRRRNCYRTDEEQMLIEVTKGRSDIYDVLTHLTFLYIEAEKIRRNSLDTKKRKKRDYLNLENIIAKEQAGELFSKEVASSYLANLIGRTFEETVEAVQKFENTAKVNSLFHIVFYGKIGHRRSSG